MQITNREARALWLDSHGLASTPTGSLELVALIDALGFVQLDSVQVVSRAHHHILWSRNQHYREPMLDRLLARDRLVFEHFTHDASVLPMTLLPLWQRQFRRMRARLQGTRWYADARDAGLLDAVRQRIAAEGPLSTRDFDTRITGPRQTWQRPPHKQALEYLWYAGELATSHRAGFIKCYDLAERVFPAELLARQMTDQQQVDGLCQLALERIGFGTLGEIRQFWEATDVDEVAAWARRQGSRLIPVSVEAADGSWSKAWADETIEARLQALPRPTSRLRILNPFDPAIRNRTRLKRLFGFDYTVEMFVPAARRRWGYYVFPLLEGSRLVGRIEVKGDRAEGTLNVLQHWHEPGIPASRQRAEKLEAELVRLARLAGLGAVLWHCPPP